MITVRIRDACITQHSATMWVISHPYHDVVLAYASSYEEAVRFVDAINAITKHSDLKTP